MFQNKTLFNFIVYFKHNEMTIKRKLSIGSSLPVPFELYDCQFRMQIEKLDEEEDMKDELIQSKFISMKEIIVDLPIGRRRCVRMGLNYILINKDISDFQHAYNFSVEPPIIVKNALPA